MNRRDIILAAVFINLGLLSLLFFFAMSTEDEKFTEQPDQNIVMVTEEPPRPIFVEATTASQTEPGDEVDNALKDYAATIITADYEDDVPDPIPQIIPPKKEEKVSGNFVEVTIKRGDALEKIARANNTTVEAIKQANHLNTDRVYIGQVLRVPVGKTKSTAKKEVAAPTHTTVNQSADAEYYVIKSGDNPWKIAKQFHVKFDDLLKLNDLDEDKAKNMKIGERIRVR